MKYWHGSNPGAQRLYYLKCNFDLTPEDYDEMIVEQSGLCAICERQMIGRDECVDHDHATGRVRGLLCQGCNQGLGRFGDDPRHLRAAVLYLTRRIKP